MRYAPDADDYDIVESHLWKQVSPDFTDSDGQWGLEVWMHDDHLLVDLEHPENEMVELPENYAAIEVRQEPTGGVQMKVVRTIPIEERVLSE